MVCTRSSLSFAGPLGSGSDISNINVLILPSGTYIEFPVWRSTSHRVAFISLSPLSLCKHPKSVDTPLSRVAISVSVTDLLDFNHKLVAPVAKYCCLSSSVHSRSQSSCFVTESSFRLPYLFKCWKCPSIDNLLLNNHPYHTPAHDDNCLFSSGCQYWIQ